MVTLSEKNDILQNVFHNPDLILMGLSPDVAEIPFRTLI